MSDLPTATRIMLQRPAVRTAGTLCAIWAFLYLPLLIGSRVLPWDAIDQFYPTVWFNAHSLRHGMAPWWNPYLYGGYPQIADPQSMLFSPLLMGWMLLRADPGATWFTWGVLLHLLMGSGAMAALLRRMGANTFGALLSAMVYLGGGVAAARLEHVPMVLAYGYLPLVLLCTRMFIRSGRPRWALALGLAGGAMLTHLVQLTWLLALMVGAYACVELFGQWRGLGYRDRVRRAVGLCLALAVAIVIALPQLALTMAFSAISNRDDLPLAAAADASLKASSFLSIVAPNADHALRGEYTGAGSRVEALFYIGALPALLLLCCLRNAWRTPANRGTLTFCAIIAAFAILYALGVNTPFYGWLYGWLPGMHHFRRPSDAAYLLNFSLAIGAGLAATSFDLSNRRTIRIVLLVAAAWLALSSAGMRDSGTRWDGVSALPAIVAMGLYRWLRQQPGKRAVAVCLLGLVAVDYRAFNLNGELTGSRDNRSAFFRDPVAKALMDHSRRVEGPVPPRVLTEGMGPGWDNLPVVAGIASAQGYNPLRYRLYDTWYGTRDNGALPLPATRFHPSTGSAIDRLLGTRYLLRKGDEDSVPASYVRVASDRDRELLYSADVYPRILSPVDIRWEDPSPEDYATADFRHVAFLSPTSRPALPVSATPSGVEASIDTFLPSRIEIDAQTRDGTGWLVLNELDCPGWQATVDGRQVPIVRANGMFRAIELPAGRHRVVFVFDPWAFVVAAWDRWRAREPHASPVPPSYL